MKYPYSLLTGPKTEHNVAARMPDSLPLIFFLNFYFYEKSSNTPVISIRGHRLSLLLARCMLPVPECLSAMTCVYRSAVSQTITTFCSSIPKPRWLKSAPAAVTAQRKRNNSSALVPLYSRIKRFSEKKLLFYDSSEFPKSSFRSFENVYVH